MTSCGKHGAAQLSKVKVARAMCIRGRQIIEEGMVCVCVCVCVCVVCVCILANRPDLAGTVLIWRPKPDVPPDDPKKPIRPDLSRSTPKNTSLNLLFACSLCSSVGIQVSSVSFSLFSCTRPWREVIQTKNLYIRALFW